jgi:methyltransferase (TIGR00027 family)
VSFARGVGLAEVAVDPLADRLLPLGLRAFVAASRIDPLRPLLRDASRLLTLGFVDHVTLRTVVIDRSLEAAVDRGVRQCVILGAGLDTRAHRLAALREVRTFEVDHPATQREKRRRMEAAGLERPGLAYVPVDFGRESLAGALEAAGHDAGAPTYWLWEGVTMYLSREATRATLAEIARRSAPSSELALTYFLTGSIRLGEPTARALFRLAGEPLRGSYTEVELGELLHAFGFERTSDTSSTEWAASSGAMSRMPILYRGERLALARRSG